MNIKKKRIILLITFITLALFSIMTGVSNVDPWKLLTLDGDTWSIVMTTRIPRTITIILVATGLSIAGLILQTINQNKYISPSTVGTVQGAKIGLALNYVFIGVSSYLVNFIFGFAFSLVFSIVFMFLIKNIRSKAGVYIPLIGILFTTALTAFSQSFAMYFNIEIWMERLNIGQFTHIASYNYYFIYVIVPAIILAFVYATKFGIIGMGKDFSENLGINYNKTMIIGLIIISIISGATFSLVGPIPLVGLIIPNLMTMYYGDNIKKSIFDIALFGSSFLLLTDIFARIVVWPFEFPISIITSIIGSIVFLYLILRRKKHHA